jgi:hypothetical protein
VILPLFAQLILVEKTGRSVADEADTARSFKSVTNDPVPGTRAGPIDVSDAAVAAVLRRPAERAQISVMRA